MIDPALFDPTAVSEEIRAQNADIVAKLAALPDPMSVPPALVRERRRQGLGPFPLMPSSHKAKVIEIDGPAGPIPLRIITPEKPRGVYFHVHGGGWTWGTSDEQDPWLDRLADRCGLAVVSVEYRLAPEDPYPAGPDDCEAAALWVIREAESRFGTSRLFIGGESAGAHLSAVTILRLRGKHGLKPFRGANLFAGCYDLNLSPSVRHWGPERLILNTNDVKVFADNFVGHVSDRTNPDISPLYADLKGLPPALFSVGTKDMLLDDTLFMASRYAAAGNKTDLAIWPGGCHVFIRFDSAMSEQALSRIDAFVEAL
ncbi:alpha/beta hydrolase [Microvirga sp. KLBC 81]|uniref:alpha/beta hydrolase n=1 Tax=Microvirga sp. KLBC 81 TaxID=1862707 RepID=UPI000D512621|nr:alpha/beta hydrolase [Microvirga sp. KLBC 81]PVE21237.1 alpha/beta hydrolase [Microvirga sp. KLBC 81]